MYTLIFKTNIESELALKEIEAAFVMDTNLLDWSVDREDIDKVLRIESKINNSQEIINTVRHAGYVCEELPD
jgi:hypothetical protein